MKIYAIAFGAVKEMDGKTLVSAGIGATANARSKEEALGTGLEFANESYPSTEGYHSHWTRILEIPEEWYKTPSKDV
jgi:hypothetical protein